MKRKPVFGVCVGTTQGGGKRHCTQSSRRTLSDHITAQSITLHSIRSHRNLLSPPPSLLPFLPPSLPSLTPTDSVTKERKRQRTKEEGGMKETRKTQPDQVRRLAQHRRLRKSHGRMLRRQTLAKSCCDQFSPIQATALQTPRDAARTWMWSSRQRYRQQQRARDPLSARSHQGLKLVGVRR